jgi:hypothetical protein
MQMQKETGIIWHEGRLISRCTWIRVLSTTEPWGDKKCEDWKRSSARTLSVTAPEGSEDIPIEQIIFTVKYTDDFVLQGMIERLIKIERYYGMEMSVEKMKVMRISREPPQIQIVVDKKQLENVE